MARLVLRVTEQSRPNIIERIRKMPVGCYVELRTPTRSLEQNARLWTILTDVANQLDWYGQKLSPEDWKQVFTAALKSQRAVPGIEGGFVVLGSATSKMTKDEMGDLMTLIEAFSAKHGVVLRTDIHSGPKER